MMEIIGVLVFIQITIRLDIIKQKGSMNHYLIL